MYKILQEKLAVGTNSQHSTITTIFATKQIYETRDATFVKDFEGVTYMFRLRKKGAAKQLLVIVQSSPFIPDGEPTLHFRQFGAVKKVVGQSHTFKH